MATYRIGCIVRVLSRTPRRLFRLGSVEAQVAVPVKLGQFLVLFDNRQQPAGYAVWAFVTRTVAEELLANPERLLHFSEWNEGTILWLMDFVAPHGEVWRLQRALRVRLSPSHAQGFAARTRPNGKGLRKMVFRGRS